MDVESSIVFFEAFGEGRVHDRYEDLHPLIDSSDARRRLEAVRIEGVHTRYDGSALKRFADTYDEDGQLVDNEETQEL